MMERLREWLTRAQAALPTWTPGRALALAGYAAFFVVTFLIAAYLTFPWDRLKAYIVQEVERPMGPGGVRQPSGWELDIIELGPSWLHGVAMRGVRVAKRSTVEGEAPPMELVVGEAQAHAAVLGLLLGRPGGSVDASLAGGSLSVDVSGPADARSIDVELEDVQLRQLGLLRAYVPVPLVGRISGDIDVVLAEDPAATAGTVDVTIEGLTAGDGQAKMPIPGMGDGITLEKIDAGDLRLAATIEEGVANITTLSADGTDVTLAGDGSLRLSTPFPRSVLDLLLYVKIKDAYRDRNERTRTLFSLLEVTPQLRRARAPDGALQFQLGGAVGGRLRANPAGNRPRPGS